MNENTIPTEVGYYWAKYDKTYKHYNLIIRIYGDKPFLKIDVMDIPKGHYSSDVRYLSVQICFGDKIKEMEK